MKNQRALLFFLLAVVFFSCDALTGEEVARLPVNFVSSEDSTVIKEVTLDLKKNDEIVFWSEMDIEYEGDVEMRFRVQALNDTTKLGGLEIDPTVKNVTLGEVKLSLGGKTSWRFTGRNTNIVIDHDGKYIFKAIFVASDNPTLKINKAELVIKK